MLVLLSVSGSACTPGRPRDDASAAPIEALPEAATPAVESGPGPRAVEPVVKAACEASDPLLVVFLVENAGRFDADSLSWDFGDGETARGVSPSHRFREGGKYRQRLTWRSGLRAGSPPRTTEWDLSLNDPPSVSIEDAGVLTETQGMGVWLQAQARDRESPLDADDLHWSFGDGTTMRGDRVHHVYEKDGVFAVTVTAVDRQGARNSARIEVEVVRHGRSHDAAAQEEDSPEDSPEEPAEDGEESLAEAEDASPVPAEPSSEVADDTDSLVAREEADPSDPSEDGGWEASGAGNTALPGEIEDPHPARGADILAVPGREPGFPGGVAGAAGVFPDAGQAVLLADGLGGAAGVVSGFFLPFETPPVWVDGVVFRHVTGAASAYDGQGALLITAASGAFPQGVIEALDSMVTPLAGAPEMHAGWYAASTTPLRLDAARLNTAADALLSVSPQLFDPSAARLLREVAAALQVSPQAGFDAPRDEWHCVEVTAVEATSRLGAFRHREPGAALVELHVSVRSQVVLSALLDAPSAAGVLRVAVPLLLGTYTTLEPGSVTHLDNLRLHTAAFAGCE